MKHISFKLAFMAVVLAFAELPSQPVKTISKSQMAQPIHGKTLMVSLVQFVQQPEPKWELR